MLLRVTASDRAESVPWTAGDSNGALQATLYVRDDQCHWCARQQLIELRRNVAGGTALPATHVSTGADASPDDTSHSSTADVYDDVLEVHGCSQLAGR